MKYLLIFLLCMVVAWRWRAGRTPQGPPGAPASPAAADDPVTMVRCSQCGLHIAQSEAITGKRGTYCSAGHKELAEA